MYRGFGFSSRMYGLSIDNLVQVGMVLADGRIVIASEEENEGSSICSIYPIPVLTSVVDLWWAL